MTIVKRPQPAEKQLEIDVERFIESAPDAGAGRKTISRRKGNRVPISLTIDPLLLERVDERAGQIGMSRAAFMAMALSAALKI